MINDVRTNSHARPRFCVIRTRSSQTDQRAFNSMNDGWQKFLTFLSFVRSKENRVTNDIWYWIEIRSGNWWHLLGFTWYQLDATECCLCSLGEKIVRFDYWHVIRLDEEIAQGIWQWLTLSKLYHLVVSYWWRCPYSACPSSFVSFLLFVCVSHPSLALSVPLSNCFSVRPRPVLSSIPFLCLSACLSLHLLVTGPGKRSASERLNKYLIFLLASLQLQLFILTISFSTQSFFGVTCLHLSQF